MPSSYGTTHRQAGRRADFQGAEEQAEAEVGVYILHPPRVSLASEGGAGLKGEFVAGKVLRPQSQGPLQISLPLQGVLSGKGKN